MLSEVNLETIEKILFDNADIISSKKGVFTNTAMKIILGPLVLILYPFLMTFVSVQIGASKGLAHGLLAFLVGLVCTPVVAIISALSVVSGAVALPFAILVDGIGYLFSKKHRTELKLKKNLEKLVVSALINEEEHPNLFSSLVNEKVSLKYFNRGLNLPLLIDKINVLTKKLGRPTYKFENENEDEDEDENEYEDFNETDDKYSDTKIPYKVKGTIEEDEDENNIIL